MSTSKQITPNPLARTPTAAPSQDGATVPFSNTPSVSNVKTTRETSTPTDPLDASQSMGTTSSASHSASHMEPTDQAVLDYLKNKGLGSAVMELTNLLKRDTTTANETSSATPVAKSTRERLAEDDAVVRTQRHLLTKSTGGGYGYDRDAAWPVVQWGIPDSTSTAGRAKKAMGAEEAQAYLDAFCSLQLWVLSLPESSGDGNVVTPYENPLERAQNLLQADQSVSLKSVIQELAKPATATSSDSASDDLFQLPPSVKPELLAVTFALLVHTYCELLEFGMESTAHVLRDAFTPIYEPLYPSEYRDLKECVTTEDMMRLNSHNSQHMEALANLKSILVQVASFQIRQEELKTSAAVSNGSLDQQQQSAKDNKIAEYDRNINLLKAKYNELSQRASVAFDKMINLPFLRRARAVRWQLTLSTHAYSMFASFLVSEESMLAMSALLQTKCELHVERRDPLPFTPSCVMDDRRKKDKQGVARLDLHDLQIQWAAPALKSKQDELIVTELPFPRYHMQSEYENERAAMRDRRAVEFNRALLVNGFRRLEALERKREFESLPTLSKKRAFEGDSDTFGAKALQPTILLTSLSASGSGPILRSTSTASGSRSNAYTDVSSIWNEAGIGLCCSKICPPDGRRVAVGCDDSSVRIWDVMDSNAEPYQVLLGHKNGFPVFDLDWNRDGRALLSAGGDGSIRLWDTVASGPFGDSIGPPDSLQSGKQTSISSSEANGTNKNSKGVSKLTELSMAAEADMSVPGSHREPTHRNNGVALAVYRGHTPSTPIWSVSFSPSGYYFCSAGGDATARLWTTDRSIPVRLFCGHTNANVNCVEWHPNCNYVITGSDDCTVRLWDIQSGRTVRLLTGCAAGVNEVKISPSGQYAAGADFKGIVHLWDLGSGKKVTEFRSQKPATKSLVHSMIHCMSFSPCGTGLATGGDDCCVRVWDVRSAALEKKLNSTPHKSFPTRRTLLMDLQFTKRNLLLAVGKYVTPVPLAQLD